jgi:hypothetical protein
MDRRKHSKEIIFILKGQCIRILRVVPVHHTTAPVNPKPAGDEERTAERILKNNIFS